MRRAALAALALLLAACDNDDEPVIAAGQSVPGVEMSDDYELFGSTFQAAARELVNDRMCTVDELVEIGGFLRSTTRQGSYFTYCARGERPAVRIEDRIYVTPSGAGGGYIISR